MKISVITLFPGMFDGPFKDSIVKRAQEKNLISLNFVDLRDFGIGKHKSVDDSIYGGGKGMILRVDVLDSAIEKTKLNKGKELVILLSATGKKFEQKIAKTLSKIDHLILICGHYEGVDERIKNFIDLEISVGDFILTGGEIPAMLVIDAISRLIPEVLDKKATENESFSLENQNQNLLEYPQYTKPETYKKQKVPKILLSGNHKEIDKWKIDQAQKITQKLRPDLLTKKA